MTTHSLADDAVLHVRVVACTDPYPADGEYVRRFWTGILGPTPTALLGYLARDGNRTIPASEAAAAVGVNRGGEHRKLIATLERLATFGFLDWTADNRVYVRDRLPRLRPSHLARLSPALQEAHAAWERQQVSA